MASTRSWTTLLCAGTLAACGPSPATQAPAAGVDARAASEQRSAETRGALCSAREAKAAGLRAEYFAHLALTGKPLLVRLEGPIDDAWPAVGREIDRPARSARWSGWIRPPVSGRYAFHTDAAGATIRVSGQRLDSAASGAAATLDLAAGRYHPITIELSPMPATGKAAAAAAALRLSWTAPHGARYLIPRAVLFPPSETVSDAPAPPAARTP